MEILLGFALGYFVCYMVDWYASKKVLLKAMEHAYGIGWSSCHTMWNEALIKAIKEQEKKE
jgi:hypothetical protein